MKDKSEVEKKAWLILKVAGNATVLCNISSIVDVIKALQTASDC